MFPIFLTYPVGPHWKPSQIPHENHMGKHWWGHYGNGRETLNMNHKYDTVMLFPFSFEEDLLLINVDKMFME